MREFLKNTAVSDRLLPRFLSYVKVWTTSDQTAADNGVQPSSERQRQFALALEKELNEIGADEVTVTSHAYVCARLLPTAGYEDAPSVCFLAHMDTVSEVSGKDVSPQVVRNYGGTLLRLGTGVILDPLKDPCLRAAAGDTIITTDGSTLLGADDKAGIAEIMTAIELITAQKIPHGQIEIIFSPDEETGHGMDNVPLAWIQSKFCYTLDGGEAGELETECFNAFKAEITFTGKPKHTGTARPDMVNAVTMAAFFVSSLPQNESPEATDGRYGFYAPMELHAHIESATVLLYLRDFDSGGMNRRIETVKKLAAATEAVFAGGKAEVEITQQYLNMKGELSKQPLVTKKLVEAVKSIGITPCFKPIRGGTDGSRLTELGLPTPNIFTGGHNFHSRFEWASLAQMIAATETVIALVKNWAAR